jgi:hypothetical protein
MRLGAMKKFEKFVRCDSEGKSTGINADERG